MSDSLTLLQLRTKARERADMVNSSFVTDAELTGYVDSSYKEFYDLLTNSVEDYNISNFAFSITSGNTQALPTDCYKLRGVDDLIDPQNPRTVYKYNFNERNEYSSRYELSLQRSPVEYRIVGNNLTFLPANLALRPYQLWYVPIAPALAADGDIAQAINGWLEYVVVDAAIKMLIKEESDTKVLYRVKQDLTDRIQAMVIKRDQSLPEKISRVRTAQVARRLYGRY